MGLEPVETYWLILITRFMLSGGSFVFVAGVKRQDVGTTIYIVPSICNLNQTSNKLIYVWVFTFKIYTLLCKISPLPLEE